MLNKKAELNKSTKNKCQNLTEEKCNKWIKLLQKKEDIFYGTLGTWKIDRVDLKLK